MGQNLFDMCSKWVSYQFLKNELKTDRFFKSPE